MDASRRNRLIRATLRAAYPGTVFEVEALSGKSGRQGYRNLAIAWTGGPQASAVQALVEGLDGGSFGLRAGYSRSMTADELETWLAECHAQEPARLAARAGEATARAEAGRAKRAETATRKAGLRAKLAANFPGVQFTISAWRHGVLRVAYVGGPALRAVEDAAGGCCVARAETPGERAARAQAQARAAAEHEAVEAELKAAGVQPIPCGSLSMLKDQLEALRGQQARCARLLAATGVGFRRPAMPRRIKPQPLLPMSLPLSFRCFAGRRTARRRVA